MLWLSFSLSLFLSLRYMACGSCQPTHPLLLLLPLGPLLLLLPSIGAIAIAVGCCYWGHCYCCCRWGHWAHPHTPPPIAIVVAIGDIATAIHCNCYCPLLLPWTFDGCSHSMGSLQTFYRHSVGVPWKIDCSIRSDWLSGRHLSPSISLSF